MIKLRDVLLVISWLSVPTVITVILEPKDKNHSDNIHSSSNNNNNNNNDNMDSSFSRVFSQCVEKKIHTTFECFNEGSLSVLRSMNDEDQLDFGDVQLDRCEGEARDLLDLDYDPKDFGNVVKAAARMMERRNLKWDLGYLYPGLMMRVGPALNGNGMLEFALDGRVAGYSNRQLGPGRMIMRSVVLPFLLGLKFSLSSLIPLVFGILLVVTKKALLLTKIALIISGLLGWNAFVNSPNIGGLSHGVSSGFPYNYNNLNGFQHHYGYDHNTINDHHYPYRPYRNLVKDVGGYNHHVIKEVVEVYDPEADTRHDSTPRNGKNFLWSRD
ncbi:uncharacterized protein LOC130677969 [Microplitis mediator]|uniref:uncharacterized protein LOC130677969 n=1 Tax=Microplitis mediator TaxID=375433 RepID=UPI002555F56F|nr:uncharacterized protein LOC130677969 [Microplitis mediator]